MHRGRSRRTLSEPRGGGTSNADPPCAKISAAAHPRETTRVRTLWDDAGWRVLFEAEARLAVGHVDADATPRCGRRRSSRCFLTRSGTGWAISRSRSIRSVHGRRPRPATNGQRLAEGFRVGRGWPRQPRRVAQPTGWAAELAIPFAALGSGHDPRHPGTRWQGKFPAHRPARRPRQR